MDPIFLLAAIGGGLWLMTRDKPKRSRALSPGDHEVSIGREYKLALPRAYGGWEETVVSGSPDIKVFAKTGDPLTIARVEPLAPGLVRVDFFSDPEKQDLVAQYMFEIL